MESPNLASTKHGTIRGYNEWVATLVLYHGIEKDNLDFIHHGNSLVIAYPRIGDENFSTFDMTRPLGTFNKQHNIGTLNAKSE